MVARYKGPPDVLSAEKLWCSPVAQARVGSELSQDDVLRKQDEVEAEGWSPERPPC